MAAAHILRIREVEAQRETAARLVALDAKADAILAALAALAEETTPAPTAETPTKRGPK